MAADDLVGQVEESLAIDSSEFQRRAREEADSLTDLVLDGVFDNPQAIIGLEYEFYAVDISDALSGTEPAACSLKRVPRRLLNFIRFEQELGLHNAELSTGPLPFNVDGLRAQEAEVAAQVRTANDWVRSEGIRLVSDGMWTIPPQGERARRYLTDSVLDDGVRVATNMSAVPRYHAMANASGNSQAGMNIDAPHVSLQADTVMPESLITSIQPHYQVPRAANLPEYLRYALRIAAPLLALGVNSPLFPPDLYDEDAAPEQILEDAWMSHRIPVFESVLNPEGEQAGKVRFPRDVETVGEAVDRIVHDDVLVPITPRSEGRFDDQFSTFRLKHGTYWRWVRPVFDGASRSGANARIEFRPLAAQPTIRDSIAFQATFSGLMRAMTSTSHPVARLPWETARANFYSAARAGFAADLEWITADGTETSDSATIFEDVLNTAVVGLRASDLDERDIDHYVEPLRYRARHDLTPAKWKLDRVGKAVTNGATFEAAVFEMQRAYVDRQSTTLLEGVFSEWPAPKVQS